ncbi:MAG: DUF1552 domain-containing protein [Planctomycetes bacterium]|nr:DUF1552 domain-containing protein [Planctomycetota bacterium]
MQDAPQTDPTGATRRAVLRGAGAVIALPWLESFGFRRFQREDPARAPLRLVVMFSGNGFHSREWWARGEGASMELGQVLHPLEPFREKLLFVRGLFNAEALKGNIHSSQTGNLLSGARLAAGGEIRSGTSIDQVVAQRLGDATKLPSLVLGCEKSNPSVHKNYSMLYSSHISWSSPTTPTPLEIYPALAFDRMFANKVAQGDRSILDALLGDANDVRRRLGSGDVRKLDEYLDSVRDVERRLDRTTGVDAAAWQPTRRDPDRERPADGLPAHLEEHMRIMCDLLVLALWTDTTRIATLKLNNDHSSQRFPHLGIDSMIHHLLSHTDSADWLRVNQFFLEQVAYVAQRLDAIEEGDRTALDSTLLLFLSSMMSGNHDADQLPVVLIGGASAGIRGGRVLDYRAAPERQMCRLYLAMMAKLGVELAEFGDARAPLAEL